MMQLVLSACPLQEILKFGWFEIPVKGPFKSTNSANKTQTFVVKKKIARVDHLIGHYYSIYTFIVSNNVVYIRSYSFKAPSRPCIKF